jgi:predicted secreted hydrolase
VSVRRLLRLAWLAALLVAAGSGAVACRRTDPPGRSLGASIDVATALGGTAETGFRRADRPRPFAFPRDHGRHDGFRTEWWYLTGNLATASGRPFGYQLTFFRQALAPAVAPSDSAWRTGHVWMGHFAVTDVAGDRFRAFERFSREALGLAGAGVDPFRVHLESWQISAVDPDWRPLRAAADGGGIRLVLELEPTREPWLQGDRGLSQKGRDPGNASYYYSMPRLVTRGVLDWGEERFEVAGLSWLDREWSTSALDADVVGWDWFALHLDDGSDLMLYRLRRADGSSASESAGSLRRPDGRQTQLGADDFEVAPRGVWSSPRGGTYPAGWRITVPAEELELEVTPRLADQELPLTVRYWEGAITARGRDRGGIASGSGYLEMTGYAGASPSRRSR